MKTNKIITSIVLILASLTALYAQPVHEFQKVVAENNNGLSSFDRFTEDRFGVSVSIAGNYAIVGSWNDKDAMGGNPVKNAGAAYIFERQNIGGNWEFVQKIVAPDRDAEDNFSSVAISGNYVIVGASGEDPLDVSGNSNLLDAGSAYIFERNPNNAPGSMWEYKQKIVAPDRAAGDYFGSGVSISGEYIIVGAAMHGPREPSFGFGTGSAYIFERCNIWNFTEKLMAHDRAAGDLFGSVSISGNYAIVGANREDEGLGSRLTYDGGAAYIFERDPTKPLCSTDAWKEKPIKIEASDRSDHDHFGYSVAISGKFAIVGAYTEDEDASFGSTLDKAGSAYIFENVLGVWSEVDKLVALDRTIDDEFGIGVAISGDYAVVGAYREDHDSRNTNYESNAGSAYVYRRDSYLPNKWVEFKKIVSLDREEGDNFGRHVSISGCTALIGSSLEDMGTIDDRAGSAYFFECERKEPVLCCDIPNLDIAFTPYRNSDMFSLNINSAGVGIQEIEVSVVDYHVEYESSHCRPNDMGIFGNIRSTTTNFGGLLLTDNNTHAPVWEAGSPSVLSGSIGILISKPNLFDIRNCRNSTFYFCLKVKITDTDCNICEKIVCGSLELGPSQIPGGGVFKK